MGRFLFMSTNSGAVQCGAFLFTSLEKCDIVDVPRIRSFFALRTDIMEVKENGQ